MAWTEQNVTTTTYNGLDNYDWFYRTWFLSGWFGGPWTEGTTASGTWSEV